MEKILDILQSKNYEKYKNIVVKGAEFIRANRHLSVEMLYPDGLNTTGFADEITEVLRSYISTDQVPNIEVVLKKSYVDKEILAHEVKGYIAQTFPALSATFRIEKSEKRGDEVFLEVSYDELMQPYTQTRNFVVAFEQYLQLRYCYIFHITTTLRKIEEVEVEEVPVFENAPVSSPREIHVLDAQSLIGEVPQAPAMYIKDIFEPCEGVVICGEIKFFKQLETKAKTDENGKEKPSKPYFKWVVKDFTGEISCLYFPTQTTLPKMEKLSNGAEVVMQGNVEADTFHGGFTFRVKQIALCILPKNLQEEVVYKPCPKQYQYVYPECIETSQQIDVFGNGAKDFVTPYLKDASFVVFDFETTGLDFSYAKIIEIGAVKITNGKILETFSSFVDPEELIPKEITELTSITQADVTNAPTFGMMLQDFYKFTRGCTLVAHNISFDYGFLNFYGKQAGYLFDNPLQDTLALAMKYVKGIKNYKLKTVATKLGVSLENAHRAVHDAMATAEVFIKIAEIIDQNA